MLANNHTDDVSLPRRSTSEGSSLAAGRLDRRTKEWRRRAELVAMFTQALGGSTAIHAMLASKIETAAELAVAAELCRASYIAGGAVSPDDVVRTANQAARAEKALGIGHRFSKPQKPRLDEYLKGRAGGIAA